MARKHDNHRGASKGMMVQEKSPFVTMTAMATFLFCHWNWPGRGIWLLLLRYWFLPRVREKACQDIKMQNFSLMGSVLIFSLTCWDLVQHASPDLHLKEKVWGKLFNKAKVITQQRKSNTSYKVFAVLGQVWPGRGEKARIPHLFRRWPVKMSSRKAHSRTSSCLDMSL